jgi:hypothetical protein
MVIFLSRNMSGLSCLRELFVLSSIRYTRRHERGHRAGATAGHGSSRDQLTPGLPHEPPTTEGDVVSDDRKQRDEHADTAFEEVMDEIADAERRTRESAEQRRHRGEAGEAITPNTHAQEESEGE